MEKPEKELLIELNESMKKLDKSIENLNTSTGVYSKIAILLSVILFVVAFFQLFISVLPMGPWISTPALLIVGMFVIYLLHAFDKIMKKKD